MCVTKKFGLEILLKSLSRQKRFSYMGTPMKSSERYMYVCMCVTKYFGMEIWLKTFANTKT